MNRKYKRIPFQRILAPEYEDISDSVFEADTDKNSSDEDLVWDPNPTEVMNNPLPPTSSRTLSSSLALRQRNDRKRKDSGDKEWPSKKLTNGTSYQYSSDTDRDDNGGGDQRKKTKRDKNDRYAAMSSDKNDRSNCDRYHKPLSSPHHKKNETKKDRYNKIDKIINNEEDSGSESPSPVVTKNDDGEEEEEYVVERIIKRRKRGKEYQYYIKWLGYSHNENTWEPASNLKGCQDKLKEFLRRVKEENIESDEKVDMSDSEWSDEYDDEINYCQPEEELKKIAEEYFDRKIVDQLPEDFGPDPLHLQTLVSREWLSDFLIDDCINHMINKSDLNKKIHYIPHHYFSAVLAKVRKDINSKDGYIPIPVVEYLSNYKVGQSNVVLVCCSTGSPSNNFSDQNSAEHFLLGVILKQQDKIILLDSLKDGKAAEPRGDIFRALACILVAMYRVENLTATPREYQYIYSKDCRRQNNNYDCGVYVIMNVLCILLGKAMKNYPTSLCRKFIYSIMRDVVVRDPSPKRDFVVDSNLVGRARREAKEFADEPLPLIEKKITGKLMTSIGHRQ